MTFTYLLLAALALLQLGDGWTTWRILAAGGQELNPAMRWLMDAVGVVPALAVKGVAVVVIAYLFFLPYPWALAAMAAVQIGVVLFNFRSIRNEK